MKVSLHVAQTGLREETALLAESIGLAAAHALTQSLGSDLVGQLDGQVLPAQNMRNGVMVSWAKMAHRCA